MDLTQGYYQAPLTLANRAYTSLITFSGVYQFTRLPFGPKRATSHFQGNMATVVLTGLEKCILMIALFLTMLVSNLCLDFN